LKKDIQKRYKHPVAIRDEDAIAEFFLILLIVAGFVVEKCNW